MLIRVQASLHSAHYKKVTCGGNVSLRKNIKVKILSTFCGRTSFTTASVYIRESIVREGNRYEYLMYVFVRFFGLDSAQNIIVVYSVLRN